MYDILAILVDFCGNFPWFWLIYVTRNPFHWSGFGSGWPKWNGSKRTRIRNTAVNDGICEAELEQPRILLYTVNSFKHIKQLKSFLISQGLIISFAVCVITLIIAYSQNINIDFITAFRLKTMNNVIIIYSRVLH